MTSRNEIQFHCRPSILHYVFYDFCKFDCTQHVEWGILLPTISYHFSEIKWQTHFTPVKKY